MRDGEVFTREILEKYKNRVYTMANAPMAEEIVKELEKRGYAPALVKLPSVQYIALTPKAKKQLAALLRCKQERLWKELEELERYLKEVEESI